MDSQITQIMRIMRGHGITSLEAMQPPIYCTRLAARIADIKDMGYDVRDEWEKHRTRDGTVKRYKRYWLVVDDERQ